MKRKNRYLIPIFAFSSSLLLANISYSAWNISNGSPEKEFVFNVSNKNSVAYFYDTKNIKREFGSVASALAVAANYANDSNKILVVVNPDTTGNVKIGDCTIAANVTLLINYKDVKSTRADNKGLGDEYTGNATNGTTFGDVTGSKSKIYLKGKRTINNGGARRIGGETGQDGVLFQGGTIGNCAELTVDAGGSIDCSGEIISYGFIHDLLEGKRSDNESAIVIHKGGKVSEPLTRYTWPGGSEALLSMKPNKIFPCNVFDLPNIRAPMLFEYGSKLIGKGKIYAFKNFFTAEADIITQDDNIGFLQLKEKGRKATSSDKWTGNAGSVLFDADDRANDKKTTSDSTHYVNHKTKIKAMGDASISGVSVTVSVETLDTREGYLPISGIFDIELQKACFNVMYDTKILPGANVVVNSDSSLTFKKNLVVYSSTTDKNGNKMNPYAFNGQTNFENNGTLKMESGADVLISTTKTDSKVIVGASYSKPSECLERVASKDYKGFEFTNGANRNRLAQRYAIDGTTSYISKGNENAVANRTYTSSATSDGKYGWTYNNEYKSYPIVIDTNGNDSAVDSNGQKYIENYGSGTVVLSNLTSKDPDKTFAGFYYDQACTKALKTENDSYIVEPSVAVGYVNNGILTIYSKWITAGLITVNQYKGQNDLTTTQSSLTSGKTYHLSDFNITGNDSRPMKKVDNVSRTEFVFQNWIIYDASDAKKSNKLSSDGSFTPESGKSYNLEPVFKTNYYLYRSVTPNSWTTTKRWYMMHNFKVTGGDIPQDATEKNKMFSATLAEKSDTSTTYTSGWISLNATISFDRESRTIGGPNYVHISIDSNEKMQVKGNENSWGSSNTKSCTIALSQYFNEDFVNGKGPISITANNKSSNVQTI